MESSKGVSVRHKQIEGFHKSKLGLMVTICQNRSWRNFPNKTPLALGFSVCYYLCHNAYMTHLTRINKPARSSMILSTLITFFLAPKKDFSIPTATRSRSFSQVSESDRDLTRLRLEKVRLEIIFSPWSGQQ